MSLQMCHCGWSKVTSYHGLRTHQGKMGCTPLGMRIPESEQYFWGDQGPQLKQKDTWRDISALFKDEYNSPDMSLQVCHCGWSKVTSYHGLRIHQGMMGCTPLGMRIPESEQYLWGNQGHGAGRKDTSPEITTIVKTENLEGSPSTYYLQSLQAAAAREKELNTAVILGRDETPSHTPQKAKNIDTARRALDFTIGLQVHQLTREPPTTTHQAVGTTEKEKKSKHTQAEQEKTKADLHLELQKRERNIKEIKASVKDCKGKLDCEWVEINSVFADVMSAVEGARRSALRPLEERIQKVKRDANELILELQREIGKLKQTIAELDKNSEGSPSLVDLDDGRNWKKMTVDTSFSFGTLKTTTSAMMEQVQQELEMLSALEIQRIPKFAVNVKLDPCTAHAQLILTDDGKEVRDGGKIQEVPDGPERFDLHNSVLGLNKLSSGKSYWEVDVGNKTGWDLGVTRRDANRKGKLTMNPTNGYWAILHYNGSQYAALLDAPTRISLKEKPQRVGVFVDYEEGLVSFYDVNAWSHIYSFTGCLFTNELYPYFSPHLRKGESNSGPLIISPVKCG